MHSYIVGGINAFIYLQRAFLPLYIIRFSWSSICTICSFHFLGGGGFFCFLYELHELGALRELQ